MKKIGITTTVPIEVLMAAGYEIIDLNNLFVTSKDYSRYIDLAEAHGFPKNICAWIKGIYGACISHDIREIVGVIEGDCSNTKGLTSVLEMKRIKVFPFAYPYDHTLENVRKSIDDFMCKFNVNLNEVEAIREKLNNVRKLLRQIDEMTYKDCKITGLENHLLQVSSSDFCGDLNKFEEKLMEVIHETEGRESIKKRLRLGYIGVPPMTADLYEFVEGFDASFIYNEVQREFAFPRWDSANDIYEQYFDYSYPYSLDFRLMDIEKQISERKIDGLIHYTQAFCHRAIEDIVIKQRLNIPILNIEGDKSVALDARTKLRLEAFLDMLLDVKEINQ